MVRKFFEFKIFFLWKLIFQKILVLKSIWVKKIIGSKIFWVQLIFLGQKYSGPKNFLSQFFRSKIFGPKTFLGWYIFFIFIVFESKSVTLCFKGWCSPIFRQITTKHNITRNVTGLWFIPLGIWGRVVLRAQISCACRLKISGLWFI